MGRHYSCLYHLPGMDSRIRHFPHRFAFPVNLRILPGESEQNCEEGEQSHYERVIEVTDDADGGDSCETCRHEELGTVWDEALDET